MENETQELQNEPLQIGLDDADFSHEIPTPVDAEAPTSPKNDNLTIALLLAVCFLCLGLIGVMIYWLETYL